MSRPRVLHFRNTFLRPSETFIARVVNNHERYEPVGLAVRREVYCDNVPIKVMGDSFGKILQNGWPFLRGQSPPFISAVVEQQQPAILHGHFGQDAFLLIPTARQFNLPLITSFYGKDVTEMPTHRIWRMRYRKLAQHGDRFVAASERMKKQLVELGFPDDRMRIVKFGLDLNEVPFEPSTTSQHRLMVVGRFVEKKGIEYALQAVARLVDDFPEIHLDVYGEGSRRGIYETLLGELGIAGHVTFHGFTANADVIAQMPKHDVLLVPSVTARNNDQEGMPNVIIEGMAAGVSLIGTRHAAIPEIILDEQTGLLVAERDALGLANAIRRMFTERDLRRRMIEEAYAFVRREHDIHQNVRRLETVYDECLPG